ncbi:MAG: S41 family peptidase [Bacteroidales bacterium]|nr:S41 family peptidase [Bacteroidales bacterium]
MNRKLLVYSPLIVMVFICIGIYIGYLFFLKKNNFLTDDINVLQKPFKQSSKLQQVLNYIVNYYVDSVKVDSIEEKCINKILEELDPHSTYIPAKDYHTYNDPLEGEYEGIGIEFSIIDDTITVMNVFYGGPSEKLGIIPGDKIVKINDTIVAGVKIKSDEVIKRLKGPKGTKVKVTIKRKISDNLLDFTIVRDKIPLHSIDASLIISKNIGYLKISRFALNTYKEFIDSLKKLKEKNINKWIIDLRGNSGGYMTPAIQIADEFLKKGELIVYTQGRARPKEKIFATNNGIAENDSVIILIDEFSASASEILAGAIQDNDRGLIIGKTSFGKGLVQQPFNFDDGSSLRLTVARYFTPSGRCIQRPFKDLYGYLYYPFVKEDSIKNKKSKIYKTKKGRIVYGNGGITPDIIVDDSINYSKFLNEIYEQSIIYKFAFKYSSKVNKKESNSCLEFFNKLNDEKLLSEFEAFLKSIKFNFTSDDIKSNSDYLLRNIKLLVIRNIYNDWGYYLVFTKLDKAIKLSVEKFSKSMQP